MLAKFGKRPILAECWKMFITYYGIMFKKSKTLALERSSFESAIVRIPNSMFSRHIFYTCKLNLPFIIEFENFYLELFSIWSHIYYCFLKLLVHQGECNNNEI